MMSDNPLQTAVLNLFVSLKYRFPNLVVGMITRDSVKKALMNGITADQVRVLCL
jgi:transcription initiation factor TFIIH subunit 4